MFVIPVADLNSQAIESVLDEELFYIIFDWNQSGQYWEMGIRNSAYITLVDGICVVPNFHLTYQFKYPDIFRGELLAIIDKAFNGSPGRNDFVNETFELVYVPYQEVIAINAL